MSKKLFKPRSLNDIEKDLVLRQKKLDKLHIDKDPYELLNTSPEAPFSELKKNYRVLALKYHPDRNKD